ncbi:uncharacterized protein PV06_04784 [Exophiala oligosperma]|uniref:Uncharacterized protein n=1 Tax=Exophiala oligosperma TaxID=215243 RepID=A0A0D2E7A9_9EURO|nr:uncharacterized protein PV06_04784 [Exophiala oligosperma]KIW43709.1 hypothetical protein PV06_04784 [Exophiala oligosperma]
MPTILAISGQNGRARTECLFVLTNSWKTWSPSLSLRNLGRTPRLPNCSHSPIREPQSKSGAEPEAPRDSDVAIETPQGSEVERGPDMDDDSGGESDDESDAHTDVDSDSDDESKQIRYFIALLTPSALYTNSLARSGRTDDRLHVYAVDTTLNRGFLVLHGQTDHCHEHRMGSNLTEQDRRRGGL